MPSRRVLGLNRRAWMRIRRRVLHRDGWRCQKCGRAGKLEVHHRKPVERGGGHSLDNLEALCRGCHINHHRADHRHRTRKRNRQPRGVEAVAWARFALPENTPRK